MPVLKDIKIGRLVLAITVTLFIADTAPHPSLSSGLLENTWNRVEASVLGDRDAATTVSELPR